METRILTVIRSVSTALVTVLGTIGYQYPEWRWVAVAGAVVSIINLNIIPAATAALAPTPVVQVAMLTPKSPSNQENTP